MSEENESAERLIIDVITPQYGTNPLAILAFLVMKTNKVDNQFCAAFAGANGLERWREINQKMEKALAGNE